jgi:hypothetical protein
VKVWKLPANIYSRYVFFLYGDSKDIHRYLVKRGLDPSHSDTFSGRFWCHEIDGRTHYFITIAKDRDLTKAGLVANLAHECDHCANTILHNCGVQWNQQNDEAHAYLIDALVEQCLTKMWQ